MYLNAPFFKTPYQISLKFDLSSFQVVLIIFI